MFCERDNDAEWKKKIKEFIINVVCTYDITISLFI